MQTLLFDMRVDPFVEALSLYAERKSRMRWRAYETGWWAAIGVLEDPTSLTVKGIGAAICANRRRFSFPLRNSLRPALDYFDAESAWAATKPQALAGSAHEAVRRDMRESLARLFASGSLVFAAVPLLELVCGRKLVDISLECCSAPGYLPPLPSDLEPLFRQLMSVSVRSTTQIPYVLLHPIRDDGELVAVRVYVEDIYALARVSDARRASRASSCSPSSSESALPHDAPAVVPQGAGAEGASVPSASPSSSSAPGGLTAPLAPSPSQISCSSSEVKADAGE